MDNGRWTMDDGQWTMDQGKCKEPVSKIDNCFLFVKNYPKLSKIFILVND